MTCSHPSQRPIEYEPGTRFGNLIVVRKAASCGNGARYLVRCECGNERVVYGASLRRYRYDTHEGCK